MIYEETLGEICIKNNVCNSLQGLEKGIFYCDNSFVKSKEDCKYLEINEKGKHFCGYYKE